MDIPKKTVSELKALCKERGIRGYSNKRKADLIQLLISSPPTSTPTTETQVPAPATNRTTKREAGKKERENVRKVVREINAKSKAGNQIIAAFRKKFNRTIVAAREPIGTKGNRRTHYDFQILLAITETLPEEWKRVELKQSQDAKPIPENTTPWAAGVQFHNGGCGQYTITSLYTRLWYNLLIGNGLLKKTFNLQSPIPTYEDWYQDAKSQTCTPKTPFIKELKTTVRAARGPKGSLLEYRETVNAAFTPTDADMNLFKREILDVLNPCLDEKDYWLTIHGDVDTTFHCEWYPKFTIKEIRKITIEKEKDILFNIECDTEFKIMGMLRWGGGAGFTNVRMDSR